MFYHSEEPLRVPLNTAILVREMDYLLHIHPLIAGVATAFSILAFCFIPLVLVRKKEPASTVAWILALVFVPVVGVVFFWFLGRDRVRKRVRRKVASRAVVREQILGFSRSSMELNLESVLRDQPDELRGVMRLASRAGGFALASGNNVDVLVGAEETYKAQLDAIAAAKDHVHLEYYIIRPDNAGLRFREALLAALKRGVRVRVLYDAIGSWTLSAKFVAPLRAAGAHVESFFPFRPIQRAWSLNMRNHRKVMVVDGVIGFAGGINIGDEFMPWRDVHLRIEGPSVGELQALFAEDWFFATQHNLVHPAFFPETRARGVSAVQLVGSGPDETQEAIARVYFAAIAGARERVWLTTPYFVPDRAMLYAMETAAMRGVDVKLIVPRHSNHRVTFHAGRSFYDELLRAGVQIYEYLPGMLHTKSIIVDQKFATIGSANLDVRSFKLNFELIAILYDEPTVARVLSLFNEDLTNTERVRHDAWKTRSTLTRVKEGYGRLCSAFL